MLGAGASKLRAHCATRHQARSIARSRFPSSNIPAPSSRGRRRSRHRERHCWARQRRRPRASRTTLSNSARQNHATRPRRAAGCSQPRRHQVEQPMSGAACERIAEAPGECDRQGWCIGIRHQPNVAVRGQKRHRRFGCSDRHALGFYRIQSCGRLQTTWSRSRSGDGRLRDVVCAIETQSIGRTRWREGLLYSRTFSSDNAS